jgi:hypothetical protein
MPVIAIYSCGSIIYKSITGVIIMRISPKIWVPVVVITAVIAGCTLDRSAIPSSVSLKAEPQLFCPTEPVTVSWDVSTMPRKPEHCDTLGGSYTRPIACDSSAECPGGMGESVCLDSVCCPTSVYTSNSGACPTTAGCLPPFVLVVTSDTGELTPPVNPETQQARGARTVTPPATTTFNASLIHDGRVNTRTASSRMLELEGATRQPIRFPFTCAGSTPTWIRADMEDPLLAGARVRVISVRNTTPNIIILSTTTPERPPVTLRPGEVTEELNGVLRGQWIAALSPLDRASLIRPRCDSTNISEPWPDLAIELQVECVKE